MICCEGEVGGIDAVQDQTASICIGEQPQQVRWKGWGQEDNGGSDEKRRSELGRINRYREVPLGCLRSKHGQDVQVQADRQRIGTGELERRSRRQEEGYRSLLGRGIRHDRGKGSKGGGPSWMMNFRRWTSGSARAIQDSDEALGGRVGCRDAGGRRAKQAAVGMQQRTANCDCIKMGIRGTCTSVCTMEDRDSHNTQTASR